MLDSEGEGEASQIVTQDLAVHTVGTKLRSALGMYYAWFLFSTSLGLAGSPSLASWPLVIRG